MLGKVVLWYLGQGTAFTFVLGGVEGLAATGDVDPRYSV